MEKQFWLKNYPEGVQHEINPDAYPHIPAILDEAVQKYPNNTAFVCYAGKFESSLTFKELDEHVNAFAGYLQKGLGLKKGARVAIQMPNMLQYPIALLGTLRAGCVVVNTNPLYTEREMHHQFNDSGAEVLVIMEMFAHKLDNIIASTKIKKVILAGPGDMFPNPKRLLINFVAKNIKPKFPKYEFPCASIRFLSALKAGKALGFTPVEVKNTDTAFLQYTGGTTGVSKGAILTHRNVIANLEQFGAWVEPYIEKGKEVIITPLPMYHIFALTVNSIGFLKLGGKNILITNPRELDTFMDILVQAKPTVMTGVNTLFNAMLNHPKMKEIDLSKMKFSVGGAMALQKAVVERWLEVAKSPLIEGYGLTEASPVVSCNPLNGKDEVGTIGYPLPSTEIQLIDDTGKVITELNVPGELCVRGPQVMEGYYNRPDETKRVITGDNWLSTGDIAVWLEGGMLKIVDRKKDMILVSGFNVFPNEVEDVIARHPKVLEVAVIGIPDAKSTEAVKAIVVPKPGVELRESEILELCKKELTAYKIPKHVAIRRTELPKSNVGKILRRMLREEELAPKDAHAHH